MTDHDDHTGAQDYSEHHEGEEWRVTSPMQDFTMSQVTTGIVVFAVGAAVTFGIPFLLA